MVARALLAAAAVAAVNAGPIVARQESAPATVNFTPYAYVGCRQSQNPYSTDKPTSWNVTTGSGCVTSSYGFTSYVESANSDALAACSLTLYANSDCSGQYTGADLTSYGDCDAGPMPFTGQSFLLACGP